MTYDQNPIKYSFYLDFKINYYDMKIILLFSNAYLKGVTCNND